MQTEESGIYLTIEDEPALRRFVKGAVKSGYLRRFDLREIVTWMNNAEYPIQVPVNLNSVMMAGQNAVVKGIFGRNIENTITKYMKAAMGTE